jgi:hypothetical protein
MAFSYGLICHTIYLQLLFSNRLPEQVVSGL